jgi:hypothetical protein
MSTAGGVVTISPSRNFHVTSLSCWDDSLGDPIIVTLKYAIEYGLREANDGFQKGIHVHKLIIYAENEEDLFQELQKFDRVKVSRDDLDELNGVAKLVEKAGIQLVICWVPTESEIYPHTLAVNAAKDHLEIANVSHLRTISLVTFAWDSSYLNILDRQLTYDSGSSHAHNAHPPIQFHQLPPSHS